MNKTTYDTKRNQLLLDAQNFLDADDVENAQKARQDIEQLDKDFHAWAQEQANINAKKGIQQPYFLPLGLEGCSFTPGGAPPPDETAKQQASAEAKMYETAFGKQLLKQPLSVKEMEIYTKFNSSSFDPQNATRTVINTKVVVPSTLQEKIWEIMDEEHPVLADLSRTFISGDLSLIVESATGDDGKWVEEGDTAASDDVGLATVELQGCQLTKAITVSWKLQEMSIDAFLVYISRKIARKMGNALANAVFSGRGTPGSGDTWRKEPRGIIPALKAEVGTPQIVTYSADDTDPLNYTKITELRAVLKSGYSAGAVFYAKSSTIWTKLANISAEDGWPVFVPEPTKGGVGRLFGTPVKEEDGVPDGQILLANMNEGYALNVNREMSMHYEDHVKQMSTDYMGYMIVDGAPITTKAFVLLQPE